MDLIAQLILGGAMIVVTFIIQAIGFDRIIRMIPWLERKAMLHFQNLWKSFVFVFVISSISAVLIIEIWLWALLYLWVGAELTLESALYFSTTTFTTVGFGDVYLGVDWRMLSGIESMNGFMLFGWATAFIWEIVTRIYRKEGEAIER